MTMQSYAFFFTKANTSPQKAQRQANLCRLPLLYSISPSSEED